MQAFFRRERNRIRNLTSSYNRPFWVLMIGLFIDRLGGALIFPFFTLYITKKFGVSMTEVGALFGVFAIASVIGSAMGGALADRFGRRTILILGLLISAFSSLLMGFVEEYSTFIVVALFVGLFSNIGGPAAQAMVADLLPPAKRAGGFGMMRIVANLSVAIGPAIGGLLAARSYLMLFICDAIASTITALIVFSFLPETKPEKRRGEEEESVGRTFAGYLKVLRDTAFMTFMLASIIMGTVYVQMNTTLAPYLRDIHGIPERGFGFIMTLNAGMVVVMQLAITRWTNKHKPLLMVALGSFLYAIGFALYGVVSTYELFLFAMVVITLGEMIAIPVSQVIVADFAPEDMRARYMAIFGFTWTISSAVGPLVGGLIFDNLQPEWLWFFTGILGVISTVSFLLIHRFGKLAQQTEPLPESAA